ncbi:hypothetical protein RHSIM_RhsimUnG0029600 [Rhododendron simsii]|uniref:Uncharacterized protein n=1 Tax=Rhododendron simsii TaxID=118357 RepID=A0A834L5S3_RHOSS|nr:hypothetical protein RHSIM_RhsimUnG0029600 [Rhododendron simsii]
MTPLNSILNTPLHSRVRFQRKKFCLRGVFISRYCQDFLFPSLSSSQTQRGNNCLSGHIHPPLPIPLTPTKRRLGDKPLPKPPAKESNMSYTSYTESVVVTFVLGAAAITSLAAAVAGSSMVPPNYSLAGLAC